VKYVILYFLVFHFNNLPFALAQKHPHDFRAKNKNRAELSASVKLKTPKVPNTADFFRKKLSAILPPLYQLHFQIILIKYPIYLSILPLVGVLTASLQFKWENYTAEGFAERMGGSMLETMLGFYIKQSPHNGQVSVADLLNSGCWCHQNAPNYGIPMDKIDSVCQNWSKCHHCIMMDNNQECVSNDYGVEFSSD
jgi:hypothetical protein